MIYYAIARNWRKQGGGGGQVKGLYADLIGRGAVFLAYLTGDGIAFAPSRFVGYTENTVLGHQKLEQRDGKETNKRVREFCVASSASQSGTTRMM
ncbi:hypothetical protein DSM14862_02765 [Sulfitobacter indolifex]|uniref:Uncharacterized protein n=1 Tax=Sulfitobacter indolifex HEL-45 TaxID=391624 RepID=A0ABP2DCA4_9RHOB|nr:hypothetical protein [Sulfitobacter indolifex]EDQ05781.1 hypothetical protein OIHEL45_03185 [Sulfitobacter indolifex HEL-45]UOA19951.1 hypothetical protein DSM14862_02765 [Sulfitobacter indolifex]